MTNGERGRARKTTRKGGREKEGEIDRKRERDNGRKKEKLPTRYSNDLYTLSTWPSMHGQD